MALNSVIDAAVLRSAGRWDAEAFEPDTLRLIAGLAGEPALSAVATVSHPTEITRVYTDADDGYPFLLAGNIKPVLPDLSHTVRVPGVVAAKIPANRLESGDVIVTRTGANHGVACAFLDSTATAYCSAEGLIVRPIGDIDGAYLAVYLASAHGARLCRRAAYGSGQPHISPPYLRTIPILRLGPIENEIGDIVRRAWSAANAAGPAYDEAERTLLDRIGWEALHSIPRELAYGASANALEAAARWDAEYFQPMNQRLRSRLAQAGSKRLNEVSKSIRRGVQPMFDAGGQIPVVDSKAVRRDGLMLGEAESVSDAFYELDSTARARLTKGDVLLNSTGRGTLGRAGYFNSDGTAVADNHVAVIRVKEEVCDPVYLSLFLNSPAGLQQTEMFQTGSSGQLELLTTDAGNVLVYLPRDSSGKVDLKWQLELRAKVESAVQAKEILKSELRKATAMVDQLIDERLAN